VLCANVRVSGAVWRRTCVSRIVLSVIRGWGGVWEGRVMANYWHMCCMCGTYISTCLQYMHLPSHLGAGARAYPLKPCMSFGSTKHVRQSRHVTGWHNF
jgi:hypothetical protein